jgi:hypothetical protein
MKDKRQDNYTYDGGFFLVSDFLFSDFDDLAELDVVLLDFPELLVFSDLLVTFRYLFVVTFWA